MSTTQSLAFCQSLSMGSVICCQGLLYVIAGHYGLNLLRETKSSDEGLILETHHGRSPLCKIKSSNDEQILEAHHE
jgi:hypothetical protein